MNRKHLNDKGLTLVELLAVIILVSFIAIFSFSLIIESTNTTRQVQVETNVRDEADLIVSQLIKALYETRQANIIENITGTGYSFLNITSDPSKCRRDENTGAWIVDQPCQSTFEKIGFETKGNTTQLIIKGENYQIQNKNIKILNDSKIIGNPTSQNSYEIVLKLEYSGRKEALKSMEFKNIIQPF